MRMRYKKPVTWETSIIKISKHTCSRLFQQDRDAGISDDSVLLL